MERRLHLSRRFAWFLAGAWLLAAMGLALHSTTLLLGGALLGLVVFLGTEAPRSMSIGARIDVAAESLIEDDPTPVKIHLRNQGSRSRLIQWQASLPGPASVHGSTNTGSQFLPRRASANAVFNTSFHLFGLQQVGPIALRISDPFGFAVLEGPAGPPSYIRVYPRIEAMGDPFIRTRQQRALLGMYEVSQPGTGFEFFGLRDYVVGDRPRDVNWKASARAGRIVVNQHEKENDAEIVVFLDTREATFAGRQTVAPFAAGCRATLAIAQAHMSQRDAVRVITYGDGIHEDRHTGSSRRFQGILDTLVAMRPMGADTLLSAVTRILPSMRPKSPVLIVSPLIADDALPQAIALLRSHDHPVHALVPVPDWGQEKDSGIDDWNNAQTAALQTVRGAGIAAVALKAEATLEQSLATIRVMQ